MDKAAGWVLLAASIVSMVQGLQSGVSSSEGSKPVLTSGVGLQELPSKALTAPLLSETGQASAGSPQSSGNAASEPSAVSGTQSGSTSGTRLTGNFINTQLSGSQPLLTSLPLRLSSLSAFLGNSVTSGAAKTTNLASHPTDLSLSSQSAGSASASQLSASQPAASSGSASLSQLQALAQARARALAAARSGHVVLTSNAVPVTRRVADPYLPILRVLRQPFPALPLSVRVQLALQAAARARARAAAAAASAASGSASGASATAGAAASGSASGAGAAPATAGAGTGGGAVNQAQSAATSTASAQATGGSQASTGQASVGTGLSQTGAAGSSQTQAQAAASATSVANSVVVRGPEHRAASTADLHQVLLDVHRRTQTAANPAFSLLRTAELVVRLIRQRQALAVARAHALAEAQALAQAQAQAQAAGSQSAESQEKGDDDKGTATVTGPSTDDTANAVTDDASTSTGGKDSTKTDDGDDSTDDTGKVTDAPSDDTASKVDDDDDDGSPSTNSSTTSSKENTPGQGLGISFNGQAAGILDDFVLSEGIPVLTSTPGGVKVTVLNRANKLIDDLASGYSLDLTTNKVVSMGLDPASSRVRKHGSGSFYTVRVDPELKVLTLDPVHVNLNALLPVATKPQLGGSGSLTDLGPKIGSGFQSFLDSRPLTDGGSAPTNVGSKETLTAATDSSAQTGSSIQTGSSQTGSTSTQTDSASTQTGSASTQADSASTQTGSASTQTDAASTQTGSGSTQTGAVSTQAGLASTQTGAASTQTGSASTQTGAVSTQTGSASTQTDATSTQTGSTSTQTGLPAADSTTQTGSDATPNPVETQTPSPTQTVSAMTTPAAPWITIPDTVLETESQEELESEELTTPAWTTAGIGTAMPNMENPFLHSLSDPVKPLDTTAADIAKVLEILFGEASPFAGGASAQMLQGFDEIVRDLTPDGFAMDA